MFSSRRTPLKHVLLPQLLLYTIQMLRNICFLQNQMGKMVELQRQIDSPISIVSSSQRLLKEERLYKVHATSGKCVLRYAFLVRIVSLVTIQVVLSHSYDLLGQELGHLEKIRPFDKLIYLFQRKLSLVINYLFYYKMS